MMTPAKNAALAVIGTRRKTNSNPEEFYRDLLKVFTSDPEVRQLFPDDVEAFASAVAQLRLPT